MSQRTTPGTARTTPDARSQAAATAGRTRPGLRLRTVDVRRTELLTPRMIRITFGGEELADLESGGNDQHVKLYFPRPGEEMPDPLTPEAFMAIPRERRPTLRTYTIRRHRPEVAEIDIDFVLHGDSGPASAFAGRARPGDTLVFAAPAAPAGPLPDADWHLLVADEAGLPAVGAILEGLPAGTRVRAYVEVADAGEEQPLTTDADADITWLHRPPRTPAGTSRTLVHALRGAAFPEGRAAAWVGCETVASRDIRRHLIRDRGLDRDLVDVTGYWRYGKTEDDAYEEAREEYLRQQAEQARQNQN